MEKYQNFIDGKWCNPSSQKWLENKDPATGDIIGMYPRSGLADIEKAVSAARKAQESWCRTPPPIRAQFLMKVADFLKSNMDVFSKDLCREMGKPIVECRGDVQEAIDMTIFCAGEGRRNLGMVTYSEVPNRTVIAFREPLGVVGAITPWNFPMDMPAWKVMPALITGNTVILKPAEDTPHSAVNLIRAFEHAGLPPGVLNLVNGLGEEAGKALVVQEGVDVISFTGSTEVGTSIAEQCPRQFKRVALEMGGKNAVIVLDDADLDLAVKGIVRSVFGMAGQRCTSAERIVVDRQVLEPLTEKLVHAASALKLGNGLDKNTDIGPIINEESLSNIQKDVMEAIDNGATLLCGGERAKEGELTKGYFYKPTLLSDVTPDMRIAQEETFGPVASIIPFDDLENCLRIVNGVKYGLSAAVYTDSLDKAMFFAHRVRVGAFFINTACVGAEIQLPFGGMKASGNGHREGAHHMLDIYTEWKSVAIQQKDL